MTATKVAKTSLKNVNSRSFKIHRSSSMALNLSNVSEFFWSWILKGFRALSICQNWPARPFPSLQRKFLFYPKHYTRRRWFFRKKNSWKKPISFAKWLVRQWSNRPVLTNGKRPKFKKRIRKQLTWVHASSTKSESRQFHVLVVK